MTGRRPTTTIW